MSRSLKKGPYVEPKLLRRIEEMNRPGVAKRVIKTWSRASTIFPQMVGHTIAIHDGRRHARSMSVRTWSDTDWANLHPRAPFGAIPRRKRRPEPRSKGLNRLRAGSPRLRRQYGRFRSPSQ